MANYTFYGDINIEVAPEGMTERGYYADFFVREFRVERSGDQPQLVLSWIPPLSTITTEIRLIRKAYTYPDSIYDGELLVTDTLLRDRRNYYSDMGSDVVRATGAVDIKVAPSCTFQINSDTPIDTELVFEDSSEPMVVEEYNTMLPGVPYFYKIFSLTPEGWANTKPSRLCEIPGTPYFTDRVWDKDIPDRMKYNDTNTELGHVVVERLEQITRLGKTLNRCDNTVLRGQLERFIRVFGYQLDMLKDKFDIILNNLRSPRNCRDEDLQCIASIIGLKVNSELPVDRQRQELLSTVALYKKKGTVSGIKAAIRMVSHLERIEIVELNRFVMCTNTTGRTTAKTLTDYPEAYEDEYGVFDPNKIVNSRVYGDRFNGHSIEVRLYVDINTPLSEIILNKIDRVITAMKPVCIQHTVMVFTEIVSSPIQLGIMEEAVEDSIENTLSDQVELVFADTPNWMLTSDTVAPSSGGITNSGGSRTASMDEAWWDIFES